MVIDNSQKFFNTVHLPWFFCLSLWRQNSGDMMLFWNSGNMMLFWNSSAIARYSGNNADSAK
jgi:hypothetical protein